MPNGRKPPQLDNIVYISVPESLCGSIGSFRIDPAILIPVEGIGAGGTWQVRDLSWEMIIAAMLKILVYDPDNEHVGYYREFIQAARPDIARELLETGISKAREKEYDAAEEVFRALSSLHPDDPAPVINLALVYEERAEVYERAGRTRHAESFHDKADGTYRRLVRSAPDDEHVLYHAARFYLRQRNAERARDLFARYLAVSSDVTRREEVTAAIGRLDIQRRMDTLFREAYDLIRLGQEADGIERIREFLTVLPDTWNAWFLLGWGLRRLARYSEGKEAFRKALEIGPEQPDTLNELAICHMELREFDACRSLLERALSIEPENGKIISNLGILCLREKKIDEARGCFLSVLELDPDDEIAKSYMSYLSE